MSQWDLLYGEHLSRAHFCNDHEGRCYVTTRLSIGWLAEFEFTEGLVRGSGRRTYAMFPLLLSAVLYFVSWIQTRSTRPISSFNSPYDTYIHYLISDPAWKSTAYTLTNKWLSQV
jgi:hypothetical protein